MKKTGFTLAEVLITLAIIGVVATMTLPALMTNTAEQQAKTGLKKVINTLATAGEMNSVTPGYDYSTITSNSTDDENSQSLFALFMNNTNADRQLSGLQTANTGAGINMGAFSATAANYAVFFRDGTAVSFAPAVISSSDDVNEVEPDGMIHGIPVIVDTNGSKGPNIMSNCSGQPAKVTAANVEGEEADACNAKANRVIKDQFAVRLRGVYAIPNNNASRWAYEN